MDYFETALSTLTNYSVAISAAVATFLGFYLLRGIGLLYIRKFTASTSTKIDDLVADLIKSLRIIFGITAALLVGFAVAGDEVAIPAWLQVLAIVVVTYQLVRAVKILFRYTASKTLPEGGAESVQGLATVIQLVVWIAGGAVLLSQLGYDITSIVAGLGIGGIAVALALQSILSDIFSSFSIYFDKPFTVGDFIESPEGSGTVERIGMKTTRVRSLTGEEIVLSNKVLTDTALHNYGEMDRRRVVHQIGFEYGTDSEKLEEFRKEVRELVNAVNKATFDRCHFKTFGDSALIHELVYYAETPEYLEYTSIEHEINMAIKSYCERKQLSMAFPTQTLHISK